MLLFFDKTTNLSTIRGKQPLPDEIFDYMDANDR